MSVEDADTISALSTPAGEGGIGIVRMSGQKARHILTRIFKPWAAKSSLLPRRLYLGRIVDPQSMQAIDEVLAVYLNKPHTYTREEMVEIHCHGGFAVQQAIVRLTLREGARLAEPGEFTKRAFLNGRIDLLQAESVLDIIESETEEELSRAMDSLSGQLSRKLEALNGSLRSLLAEIEAYLDFPDEELVLSSSGTEVEIDSIVQELSRLIVSYYEGRGVREGFEVLILGRTNVGKSSLLNALLLQERAIVTPLPGTTRDLIEETIHIKGIKVRLVDTAGLRQPGDVIEEEGIERVKQKIPGADLILWILDASQVYTGEDDSAYKAIQNKSVIAVLNKTDLPQKIHAATLPSENLATVETSATKGEGIESLKEHMYESLMGKGHKRGVVLITHARHRDALERARSALQRSLECIRAEEPKEFVAFEVREAMQAMGDITGETRPEAILDEIFSRFCIGK
jgi:tRNA modification GTPase